MISTNRREDREREKTRDGRGESIWLELYRIAGSGRSPVYTLVPIRPFYADDPRPTGYSGSLRLHNNVRIFFFYLVVRYSRAFLLPVVTEENSQQKFPSY